MSELRARLVSIVADHTSWPTSSIADTTRFFDEMGFDSLDLIDMRINVERAFEIEITDAEQADVGTFGDLLRLVERKIAARQTAGAVS